MNVLSLFDGISCGRVALERAGVDVTNYYASEVDKHAIKVAQHNYPDTIQLGSVVDVSYSDGLLKTANGDFEVGDIDLLIGGSPCQNFSFSGKQKGLSTKEGHEILDLETYLNFKEKGFEFEGQSYLFWEYVRLLHEIKPKYFLLENVKMVDKWKNLLSKTLGVEPVFINSSLVSAQNRPRYYWCNWDVDQPEDKGLVLKDILEDVDNNYRYDVGRLVNRKINPETGKRDDYNPEIKKEQFLELRKDDRSGTLTTVTKDNVVVKYNKLADITERYYAKIEGTLSYTKSRVNIRTLGERARCLSAQGQCISNTGATNVFVTDQYIRKLTPIECERLQTLSDNYTSVVSNSQRYRALGNGWTVDVIKHIFESNEQLMKQVEK